MKISIDGILGIQRAEELKALLLPVCGEEGNAEIFHANISEIDVTYLQILTALIKTCAAAGRQLSIYPDSEGRLQAAIDQSGFLNIKLSQAGV